MARFKKSPGDSNLKNACLFVKEIDKSINQNELKTYFAKFGEVKFIKFFQKTEHQNAIVKYSSTEECLRCIKDRKSGPFNFNIFFKKPWYRSDSSPHTFIQDPQIATDGLNGLCGFCRTKAYFRCNLCKSTWYCSPECQAVERTVHLKSCMPSLEYPNPMFLEIYEKQGKVLFQKENTQTVITERKQIGVEKELPNKVEKENVKSRASKKDTTSKAVDVHWTNQDETNQMKKSCITPRTNDGFINYSAKNKVAQIFTPKQMENKSGRSKKCNVIETDKEHIIGSEVFKSLDKKYEKEANHKDQDKIVREPVKQNENCQTIFKESNKEQHVDPTIPCLSLKSFPDYNAHIASDLKVPTFKRKFQAKITHYVNPHEFFMLTCEDAERLASQNFSSNILFEPKVYDLCTHYDQRTQKWYRAEVLQVQPHGCLIQYIDQGKSIEVDNKDIYRLPESAVGIPKLALKCQLHDVDPINPDWTDNNINNFGLLVEDQIFVVEVKIVQPSGKKEVELKDLDGENLQQMLIELQDAVPRRDATVASPLIKSVFPNLIKDNNVTLFITHIDEKTIFAMTYTNEEDFLSHCKMLKDLQDDNHVLVALEQLIPGDIVVAQSTEFKMWIRAQVIDISEEQIKVLFFDYGYEEVIKKAAYIKPEFMLKTLLIKYTSSDQNSVLTEVTREQKIPGKIAVLDENSVKVEVSFRNGDRFEILTGCPVYIY